MLSETKRSNSRRGPGNGTCWADAARTQTHTHAERLRQARRTAQPLGATKSFLRQLETIGGALRTDRCPAGTARAGRQTGAVRWCCRRRRCQRRRSTPHAAAPPGAALPLARRRSSSPDAQAEDICARVFNHLRAHATPTQLTTGKNSMQKLRAKLGHE